MTVSAETLGFWQDRLWQLKDELHGLEISCDLFTYDRHIEERLALWDALQGAEEKGVAA